MERCIYVIYADEDRDIAEQMCEFLERKKVKCYYKHRDIPAEEYDNQMFESSYIESSSCIVAIISNNFVKSDKIKSITYYADKCILFTIDNIILEECGLAAVTSVNAVKHPTKMFGHVLPEIKKLIGDSKKHKYSISAVVSIIGIIFIFALAFFTYDRTINPNEKNNFSEYKDISLNDFLEKNMLARQSPIIETELPFGKTKYGISFQEWQNCMKRMADDEGLTMEYKIEEGVVLPRDLSIVEINTSKNLRITLEPQFNEDGALYALITKVERIDGFSKNLRSLLDEVLTEIVGISDKYSNYEKYHVLKEGQIRPFYCLIKNNELINVRVTDAYNVEIYYINVPCMPKDQFDADYMAYQFHKRNIH